LQRVTAGRDEATDRRYGAALPDLPSAAARGIETCRDIGGF
jgi:hypothetical protein